MAILRCAPRITNIGGTFVSIWLLADSAATVTVTVREQIVPVVIAASPFTGHARIDGLRPKTRYTYTATVSGVTWGPYEFQTMPEEGIPSAFDLILTSDPHEFLVDDQVERQWYYAHGPLLRRKHVPWAWLMIGDFEIGTGAWNTDLATRQTQLGAIRAIASAAKQNLWATAPLFHMWDDHDGGGNNNAGLGQTNRALLRTVYEQFYAGAPARAATDGLGVYASFRIGDVLIVMLDDRTYASPNAATFPADPAYSPETQQCWGPTQLAWLQQTLLDNASAPLKIITNGTSILDSSLPQTVIGAAARDSVGLYHRKERNTLIQFLTANPAAAKGLVFVTGDNHCQRVWNVKKWRKQIFHNDPDPLNEDGAILDAPPIVEIKVGTWAEGPGSILDFLWNDNPDRVYGGNTRPSATRVEINTTGARPSATFRIFTSGLYSGNPAAPMAWRQDYSFQWVDGEWYFPEVPLSSSWTPGAGPGTPWTPLPPP